MRPSIPGVRAEIKFREDARTLPWRGNAQRARPLSNEGAADLLAAHNDGSNSGITPRSAVHECCKPQSVGRGRVDAMVRQGYTMDASLQKPNIEHPLIAILDTALDAVIVMDSAGIHS